MGQKGLPEYLEPFFWDVNFRELTASGEASFFIISRLMEHGDDAAMRFLLSTYTRREMIGVLKESRSLSSRSRHFWSLLLDCRGETCTPKRYPTPYGGPCER